MINKFTIWGHWQPHAKSWLIGKDFEAGRDWGQEEKGTTEDEKAGWHRLDRHEFEWTPGDGDGQGGLACCHSWGCKESDTTERLNWTELSLHFWFYYYYKQRFTGHCSCTYFSACVQFLWVELLSQGLPQEDYQQSLISRTQPGMLNSVI